jgi:hypothetical protein
MVGKYSRRRFIRYSMETVIASIMFNPEFRRRFFLVRKWTTPPIVRFWTQHIPSCLCREPFDIVVYTLNRPRSDGKIEALGVVLDNGTVQPLCVVSEASSEYLWDDAEPVSSTLILRQLDAKIFYGQRQIGGGRGPGNPHGEESEDVFEIIDKLPSDIFVPCRPNRDMLKNW